MWWCCCCLGLLLSLIGRGGARIQALRGLLPGAASESVLKGTLLEVKSCVVVEQNIRGGISIYHNVAQAFASASYNALVLYGPQSGNVKLGMPSESHSKAGFKKLVFSISVRAHVGLKSAMQRWLPHKKQGSTELWQACSAPAWAASHFSSLRQVHRAQIPRPTALALRHSMLSSSHTLTGSSRRSSTFLSAQRPTVHGLKVASHSKLLAPTLHLSVNVCFPSLAETLLTKGQTALSQNLLRMHA